MKNIYFYQTKIGQIGIAEENNKITNVFFETDKYPDGQTDSRTSASTNGETVSKGYYLNETDLLKEASSQLQDYLFGKRRVFSLPLAPTGTSFMKNVWGCLTDIPYGKTKSYKEIAEAIGNAKACRAIGLANNRNPIPIFIPCHRVIGADGKLTGYRGGLQIKLQLLELEQRNGNIYIWSS